MAMRGAVTWAPGVMSVYAGAAPKRPCWRGVRSSNHWLICFQLGMGWATWQTRPGPAKKRDVQGAATRDATRPRSSCHPVARLADGLR